MRARKDRSHCALSWPGHVVIELILRGTRYKIDWVEPRNVYDA